MESAALLQIVTQSEDVFMSGKAVIPVLKRFSEFQILTERVVFLMDVCDFITLCFIRFHLFDIHIIDVIFSQIYEINDSFGYL
ncbi:MAG: hypothetical protein AB9834_14540 [Lentimicrobium sp.]